MDFGRGSHQGVVVGIWSVIVGDRKFRLMGFLPYTYLLSVCYMTYGAPLQFGLRCHSLSLSLSNDNI